MQNFQDVFGTCKWSFIGVFSLSKWDCLSANVVGHMWSWAKFFHENFPYIILYQLSKHQDQIFASPVIKESVFLKSSLGT